MLVDMLQRSTAPPVFYHAQLTKTKFLQGKGTVCKRKRKRKGNTVLLNVVHSCGIHPPGYAHALKIRMHHQRREIGKGALRSQVKRIHFFTGVAEIVKYH